MMTNPSAATQPTPPADAVPDRAVDEIRAHPWPMRLLAGISIVLGVLALAFPWVSTLAAQSMLAALLVVAGLSELVAAVRVEAWGKKTRGLSALSGVLSVVAAVLLAVFPLAGVLTTTLLVSAAFLSAGIVRLVVAFRAQGRRGRGYLWVSAAASVLLAVVIVLGLPFSAFWVLGTLLGAQLIAHGIALFVLIRSVRTMDEETPGSETPARRGKDDRRVEQYMAESFPASDAPGYGR